MSEVIALALKDLKLLARDKAAFFFTLGFPLIYAVLFGMIFGGDGGSKEDRAITLAVVDEDQSESSREFVAALDSSDELKVVPLGLEEARQRVRSAKASAWLRLPPGFGTSSGFSGKPPVLELGVDPSRKAEAGMLEGLLMRHGFETLFESFSDPDALKKTLDRAKKELAADEEINPVRRWALTKLLDGTLELSRRVQAVDQATKEDADGSGGVNGFSPFTISRQSLARKAGNRPRSAFDVSFPQSIAWAIMGAAAGFAVSLAIERSRGTLLRLRAAPMSPTRVLYGKALACFLTNLTVIVLLLGLGIAAFGVRIDDPLLLVLAVLSCSFCFVGLMALLAVIGKTEQGAGGIGWAVFLVMAMLGGGMMPLFLMPSWMRTAGMISPVRWSILALEGSIWRGFDLSAMLLPCGVLVGIGVAALFVADRLFRVEMSR